MPDVLRERPAQLHQTWNEPIEDPHRTGVFNRDFFGGDLQGIQEKLGYLKSLGVDAIWMTPIFAARSNHRYDTDDYLHVDPALGGDAAFAALAAAARARGDPTRPRRRVQPRLVGQRLLRPLPPLRERRRVRVAGLALAKLVQVHHDHDALRKQRLRGLVLGRHAARLRARPAAVRDFFYRGADSVVRHWVDRGADGWRLDAADQLDHNWWRDFRTTVKSFAPDAAIVGEIWPDATDYLLGNEFDSVMNYRFRRAVDGFVRTTDWSDSTGKIPVRTPTQLDRALRAVREDYPPQAMAAAFNLPRLPRHEPCALHVHRVWRHRFDTGARAARARSTAPVHIRRSADDLLRRRGGDQRAGARRC